MSTLNTSPITRINQIDENGLEELFAPLDTRNQADHFIETVGQIAEEENIPITPETEPVDQQIVTPQVTVQLEAPSTIEYPDGKKVTIAQTTKGWQAILDPGNGTNAEVFYGNSKDELFANIAVGKINATQKIQRMNRQQKIITAVAPAPAVAQAQGPRELTADEKFQLKTQLTADPSLALETWFQAKFGIPVNLAAQYMQAGRAAKAELDNEVEAKGFVAERPQYFPTDYNYNELLKYLDERHLNFTKDNLVLAFDELSEAGLLEFAQEEEPLQPVTQPQTRVVATPTAVAPNTPTADGGRIVRQQRRMPAGLGIRENTSSVTPQGPSRPPSAEELDDLPTEEIQNLFSGVRKMHVQRTSVRR